LNGNLGSRADRWTKQAVLLSALGAVSFQAWYSALAHPYIAWTLLIVPALVYVAGRYAPERTAGAIFAFGYLVPTILIRLTGLRGSAYQSVWVVLLLAAIAGTRTADWHIPARVRFAIVVWALAVAATWPIVALREIDWTPSVLLRTPVTRNPAVHAVETSLFVAGIAQIPLIGTLWLDWLFGRFNAASVAVFERRIIRPVVVASVLAALLAMYQGFVNLEYPRQGLWAHIGRASGAMDDGNASGALAAMAVAFPIALTLGMSVPARLMAWAASSLMLVGMWQTGSRSATLCAAIALAGVAYVGLRRSRGRVLPIAAVLGIVIVGGLTAPRFFHATTSNPLSRMQEFRQLFDTGGLREVGRELWRRNGYGAAAALMIRDEPVQGVGVGTFQALSGFYGRLADGDTLPVDNAQNWIRHQLAELGLVGALGPLAWCVLILAAIVAPPAAPENRDRAAIVKCSIVGFGTISLLGVPGQNLFVAMTMWTLCGWLLLLVTTPDRVPAVVSVWPPAVAAMLTIVLTVFTFRSAWHELRPPFRAKRFDYPYTAGFYTPIDEPVGTTVTTKDAVIVPKAQTATLKLTLWVEHPDADQNPVHVEAWLDNVRVVRSRFARNVRLVRYLSIPRGERFVFETRVDRTFPDPGHAEPEVGLNVTWQFVDTHPRGALTAEP
jgi:hypothetical protein